MKCVHLPKQNSVMYTKRAMLKKGCHDLKIIHHSHLAALIVDTMGWGKHG